MCTVLGVQFDRYMVDVGALREIIHGAVSSLCRHTHKIVVGSERRPRVVSRLSDNSLLSVSLMPTGSVRPAPCAQLCHSITPRIEQDLSVQNHCKIDQGVIEWLQKKKDGGLGLRQPSARGGYMRGMQLPLACYAARPTGIGLLQPLAKGRYMRCMHFLLACE